MIRVPPVCAVDAWGKVPVGTQGKSLATTGLNTIDIDHGKSMYIRMSGHRHGHKCQPDSHIVLPMGHDTPRIPRLSSGCSRMTPASSLLVKDEDGCILLGRKVMPSTRNGELFPPVRRASVCLSVFQLLTSETTFEDAG